MPIFFSIGSILDLKNENQIRSRYLKMIVLISRTKVDILYETKKMIDQNNEVITDDAHSFKRLDQIFRKHLAFITKDKCKGKKIQR